MNNHKKIILSLTLLTLAMIHGCSHDNTTSQKVKTTHKDTTAEVRTAKEISKIESEIYTALKKSNASSYRSILGGATSDEEIADYDNINLLSVKIVSDPYEYKIKLFYDESLLNASIFAV